MTKAFIDIVGRDFTGPAFGKANSNITGTIAKVGALASSFAALGATVGAGAAFNQFTAFNRSLSEVSTLTSGTAISLDKLSAASKRMAIQFGSQPVEQTKAFYQIISAGAQTTAQAIDTLTAANTLAVAGVTDVATAADGLTSILNAYGDGVKSAADVSDILFVGMRSGKTTIEELSSGLGKVTPIAASLGVGFDELVASVAALTKGGISTTESITGIRAVLAAVAKPTKEAADEAARLGIQFTSTGLASKGFAAFLTEIQTKTGGSTDSLAKLFGGVEALVPVMAFAGQAGEDFNVVLQEMTKRAGLTQEGFELMAASPGFKVDQLMAAISTAGISLGAVLSDVLLPAITSVTAAFNGLFTKAAEQSPIEKQISLIADLKKQLASIENKKNIPLIGDLIFDKRAADLLKSRIEFAIEDLAKLGPEFESIKKISKDIIPPAGIQSIRTAAKEVKSLKRDSDNFADSLKKEARALEIATDPLRKRNDELARLVRLLQVGGLDRDIFDIKAIESISNYEKAIASISDTIEVVESDTSRLAKTSRTAFSEMDQYAIGAARNIQSAFANFLFDPFEGGLKGMFKSFANILRRMVAEMAASGLLRAVSGGSSLFSGFGGGTSSGGGSSSIFSTSNLFNGASLLNAGTTIYQGFSGGLLNSSASIIGSIGSRIGSTAAVEFAAGLGGTAGTSAGLGIGVFSNAGGAGTAFIGGSGTAIGGAGASGAASAGVGAAGAIPIVGWAILANTIANGLLENDKKVAGLSSDKIDNITRLGLPSLLKSFLPSFFDGLIANPAAKLITALFGRGTFKQKETNLIGTVTGEGFDGVTSTKIKSQGGAFVSDITKRVLIDLKTGLLAEGSSRKFDAFAADLGPAVKALGEILDGAISVINTSVSKTAAELGLGSTSGFSTNINIASEKGQFFTPEQITSELQRVEGEFVRYVLPSIDTLAKAGETVIQTFQRIGVQFELLTNLGAALGNPLADSRSFLQGVDPQQQQQFIDSAGGIEELGNKISFFTANFLTTQEQLAISQERVIGQFKELNLNADITTEQFKDLVQGVDITTQAGQDLLNSLLGVAQEWTVARKSTDEFNASLKPSAFYMQNFMSATENQAAQQKELNTEMEKLGLSSISTREQFRELVESFGRLGGITTDQLLGLYKLEGAFASVTDGINSLASSLAKERNAFTSARRESQSGRSAGPTIATTINGKIFTETEIRQQQQDAIQESFQAAKSFVSEQLSRLNSSVQETRGVIKDQLSAAKETLNFFGRFKENALEIANASYIAAQIQLSNTVAMAKAGASFAQIDTPELSNAINTLKQDRSNFFATSKEFELDKASNAQQLRELSAIGVDKADSTIDLLGQQLEVMQSTFDLQTQSLNAQLQFINFQAGVTDTGFTASVLSNAALGKAANQSVFDLNQAERIQRNTSFNGSVVFPGAPGTNQSADALDNARLNNFSILKGKTKSGGDVSSDIVAELKALKTEIKNNKDETNKLFNLMNNVTNGGYAIKTVAA